MLWKHNKKYFSILLKILLALIHTNICFFSQIYIYCKQRFFIQSSEPFGFFYFLCTYLSNSLNNQTYQHVHKSVFSYCQNRFHKFVCCHFAKERKQTLFRIKALSFKVKAPTNSLNYVRKMMLPQDIVY